MTAGLVREETERFRDVIAQRLGLWFDNGKLDQLHGLLQSRMQAVGAPTVFGYLSRFGVPSSFDEELLAIAQQLTVSETYFFRHHDQIRAFAETALPERIQAQGARRQLRILSAGCSSGEEPYTLAIEIRERLADFASWHIDLIGIDICAAQLNRARRGVYSAWSLREASDPGRRRYFTQKNQDFTLDASIRAAVSFQTRNLMDDAPEFWKPQGFDVIFCRNVLMYFTPQAMHDVVARFAASLAPGGFLFLGPAETLRGVSHAFHLCHTHDTFYYQLRPLNGAEANVAQPFTVPVQAAAPPAAPAEAFDDQSWSDVIMKSSERIAALTEGEGRDGGGPDLQPPSPSWDLAAVTELMRQERYHDATQALHAMPPEIAGDADAQMLLAVAFAQKGETAEAAQICRRILAMDELNAGAHYLMALCREHDGEFEAAWDHDQTATYLDPLFAMPHLQMGRLAKAQSRLEAARREYALAYALLEREDASRILLFGGGFNRTSLLRLCRTELQSVGGAP